MIAADLIVGQIIGLLLAIPSFLLYSLQCAIVIGNRKNNHFNTSFYKFFLLSAFNNLFLNFLCSSMFGMRLTWIPSFVNFFLSFPPWLSGAVFAINYYNLHAENLLTIFMLFQRLTAILRPFDFEKIWHFLLPISAFLCFSLPLLPIWHLFGLQVRYYQIGSSVYLSYDHSLNVTSTMPSNSQILFIASAISLLLYCILNAVIFAAFKASQGHHQNSNSANNGGGRSRIEFRLLIYSIAIFFAQSLVCIYWIWTYIFTNNYNLLAPLFNQYIWLNDLRTVVLPSWFLLWASGEMRKNVKEIVFKFGLCLKPKTTSNSLAQSNVAENENGGQRLFTRTTPRNP